MFKSINQSMINRSILRGGGCKHQNNYTVTSITIDVYALSTDTTNLYIYKDQLFPIIDMMRKNRLCNIIETVGLDNDMSIIDDDTNSSVQGTIGCINTMQQQGKDNNIEGFNWSIFIYLWTYPPSTDFTKVFDIQFETSAEEGDEYTVNILTKPVKFIDDDTDLTDAIMAQIKLIYN